MAAFAYFPVDLLLDVSEQSFWDSWWAINLIYLILSLVIWAAFHTFYSSLNRKLILKMQLIESEQKALRAQMTPHFIFNSLNSIQQLIADDKKLEALNHTAKFAKIMRLILENSKSPTVLLREELNTLRLYIELEALRLENKIEFKFDIDPSINTDEIYIPTMLIQPYVENSIWHGIRYKQGKGLLSISLRLSGEILVCTVEDDGIGRKKAMEYKSKYLKKHQSSGMDITKKRLELLNSLKKSNLDVKITDLVDDQGEGIGTKVEIFIPLK